MRGEYMNLAKYITTERERETKENQITEDSGIIEQSRAG